MILLPAIDLIDGRCVRLRQGEFDSATAYSDDPVAALDGFVRDGATEIHIVDLDGTRAGEPRQTAILERLAASTDAQLQVAGGIRTAEQVESLLAAGIARVVIGSLALLDPAAFATILDRFRPDRITLALDVRVDGDTPMVATHGWTRASGRSLNDVLADFPTVRHLLVTDIARDGMLDGPNIPLTASIASAHPAIELQGSGGVSALDDLDRLRNAGAARAVVGKAIWEERFTVPEGVARARG
jgi:phosphoribosylformimino-5-aminoimidazole carboxamide ribotide isomerase